MSKKDDEFAVKIIVYTILAPIVIIYLLIKSIVDVVDYINGSSNTKSYKLNLTSDEKEQLNIIDQMEGHEFEKFMAALIKQNGYTNVEVTKASGDYGADILGKYNGVKYAFQCKRFDKNVGPKPIGEVLRGINYYKCERGIVVTNNYFTKQARIEANINNIELWDRKKVLELCRCAINSSKRTQKNNCILNNERFKRVLILFVSFLIVIGMFFGIKEVIHEKLTKNLGDNTINYYDMGEVIYNIARNSVNNDEFSIELDKKYDIHIDYVIKNREHSIEEYDLLLKNEVTKVYEKIKAKELIWNTIWGQNDCSGITISFRVVYKKSNYNEYIGKIELKYSNDNKWTESYEKEMSEMSINEMYYNEIKESI